MGVGSLNIVGLSLLGTARQQDHDVLPIAAVVHPVSWAMTDPQFGETSPERLVVAEVSTAHPIDALLHAGQDLIVLLMEPVAKVVPPVLGDVVDHLNHHGYHCIR